MGYTHYFEQRKAVPAEAWLNIMRDTRRLTDDLPKGVTLATDGDQALEITEDVIFFNGQEPDDYETFNLSRDGSKDTEDYRKREGKSFPFTFCKTAQMPYDLMVCAVLILANKHAPDCYDISSDGTPDDWQPALDFVRSTIGPDFQLPPRVRSLEGFTEEFQAQYRAEHPGYV